MLFPLQVEVRGACQGCDVAMLDASTETWVGDVSIHVPGFTCSLTRLMKDIRKPIYGQADDSYSALALD
jgi:hypothetical protein